MDGLELSWSAFTAYPIIQVYLAVLAIAIHSIAMPAEPTASVRSYADLLTDFDRAPTGKVLDRVVPTAVVAPSTAIAPQPGSLSDYVPGVYFAGAAIAEPPSR